MLGFRCRLFMYLKTRSQKISITGVLFAWELFFMASWVPLNLFPPLFEKVLPAPEYRCRAKLSLFLSS